jgi:hypothetical protein
MGLTAQFDFLAGEAVEGFFLDHDAQAEAFQQRRTAAEAEGGPGKVGIPAAS